MASRQQRDSPTCTPKATGAFAKQNLSNRMWVDSVELIDSFAHAVWGALEIQVYPSKERIEQGLEIAAHSGAHKDKCFPVAAKHLQGEFSQEVSIWD